MLQYFDFYHSSYFDVINKLLDILGLDVLGVDISTIRHLGIRFLGCLQTEHMIPMDIGSRYGNTL